MGNHPNFLKSLGHGPGPQAILIASNGLESNSQQTSCQNVKQYFGAPPSIIDHAQMVGCL